MQKRLYRSQNDRVVAGVCGGIGEYLNIDSTIIRLLCLVGIFAFNIGIIIYIIAAIVIPDRETGDYYESDYEDSGNFNRGQSEKVLGYGLIIVGILLMLNKLNLFRWLDFKTIFPILLIICGIMVLKSSFDKN